MMRIAILLHIILLFAGCNRRNATTDSGFAGDINIQADSIDIPDGARRLIEAYDCIVGYSDNHILFDDGSTLRYDDGSKKSFEQMLNQADIEDMFHYPYLRDSLPPTEDPGRVRCDSLMRKLYGATQAEVERSVTKVDWCPNLVGGHLRFSSRNGAAQQLRKVSAELDQHPEWREYLKGASTLNWRYIAGTKRLSPHSFGNAIDIAVPYADYWRWAKEDKWRNRIPMGIVEIFERHGFIWGGRWARFDTMHFEYRPELLNN